VENLLDQLVIKAYECGEILLNANYSELDVESKEGIGNLVTKYDKMIQDKLNKELLELVPDANFVGEESKEFEKIKTDGYTFIVDPIDGTYNFARNLKSSAISIALFKDGEPYMGVCYNPYIDEMYKAEKGKGAYLNNKLIHVSNKKIEDGIMYMGSSPYYPELRGRLVKVLGKVMEKAVDYRRAGSAVLELLAVAAGRVEGYIELKVQPWDCGAASLIVTEAGGTVTTEDGTPIDYNGSTSIVASNGQSDLLQFIVKE
jgi:myo-inositol-1(or 4)-monophosphatase